MRWLGSRHGSGRTDQRRAGEGRLCRPADQGRRPLPVSSRRLLGERQGLGVKDRTSNIRGVPSSRVLEAGTCPAIVTSSLGVSFRSADT